jgi:DNA polymerase-1
MKKKILLIDGENILHQSFHKFENLKSPDGKPSGAIFGFFKSLHMYITRFNPDIVNITFDNGHSSVRNKLLPDYKGHRKNISIDFESLQSQKKTIINILNCLKVPYIYDKGKVTDYEGDDLLAYIVLNKYKNSKITIVSSDKDFNQLISKRVKIFNPRKEQIIREDNCKEIFGYSPKETVDYLSMVGDTSDDISGFKGIGPVKARTILDKYPSVWKYLDINDTNLQIYKRNIKLIDLQWFIGHVKLNHLPIKRFKHHTINNKRFREICISYSLSSFMTDMFMLPFKNLLK